MTTIDEALGGGINATLSEGIDWLSRAQEVTFYSYVRVVLPLDGFVFWVRDLSTPAKAVKGSFHYATTTDQAEDETAARNTAVFTTRTAVNDLNEATPERMWVAEQDGRKFGFSSRGRYYEAAGIHHYSGMALLPAMQSQLVDDPASLDPDKVVVGNSLPAFLYLNSYEPPYCSPFHLTGLVTLFPSHLVAQNAAPPYGSVDILNSETPQSAPFYDRQFRPWSETVDDVRIITYGLDNGQAMILRDTVLQFSYDWGVIGILDFSAVQDEKRTQPEFGIIGQKKTMTFKVSYMQTAIRDIARKLIEKAKVQYAPQQF